MKASKQTTWEDYEPSEYERLEKKEPLRAGDERGPFERDRSRIIHSAAFRRLQGKTQVYGLGASDYYRTRLTHSLEVAQLGKGLALRLGADTSLVEAVCLAHDIGHPPFGHSGEYALNEAMADFDGFNGNAQNIRILTDTERKSEDFRGLNLTIAALDGLIKYPWAIDPASGVAKGYYKSDEALVRSFSPYSDRTFECEIMNWADDLAYSSHDLEDALVIGTVRKEDLQSDSKRNEILTQAAKSYGKDYPSYESDRPLRSQDVDEALEGIIKYCMRSSGDRQAQIKTFIGQHISDCIHSATQRTRPKTDPRQKLRRYRYTVELSPDAVRKVEIYKAVTYACVILTGPVLTLQQAGRGVVRDLYFAFADSGNRDMRYWYPADWRDRVDEAIADSEDAFALKRLSRDYVATMTDRYAEEQWRRLSLPGEGGLFVARA